MIYGKTSEERTRDFKNYVADQGKWREVFVWLPTYLECGRVAWLEKVETRRSFSEYFYRNGHYAWHTHHRARPQPPEVE